MKPPAGKIVIHYLAQDQKTVRFYNRVDVLWLDGVLCIDYNKEDTGEESDRQLWFPLYGVKWIEVIDSAAPETPKPERPDPRGKPL